MAGRQSRLTPTRCDEIAAMIRAGVPTKQICRQHQITFKTLIRAQKAGLLPPCCRVASGGRRVASGGRGRSALGADLAARINVMVAEGLPYNEIGRRVGVQGKTISRWANWGWVRSLSLETIAQNRIAAALAAHADPVRKAAMVANLRQQWADPVIRARRTAAYREAAERRKAKETAGVIIVPAWVPRSLHDTYLTLAYSKGEEEAASEVRRLKREQRVAA